MKQDQLNKQDQQIQELTKQYNKSCPINLKLENLEQNSTENNDNFKQLENWLNSLELTIRKSSESNTERQMDLHSTNKELVMENKQLKSKVVELEQQLTKESRLVDGNKMLVTENTELKRKYSELEKRLKSKLENKARESVPQISTQNLYSPLQACPTVDQEEMYHYKHAQQSIRMKYTITSMPNSRSGGNAPLQACPTVDQEGMHHYKHAQQ